MKRFVLVLALLAAIAIPIVAVIGAEAPAPTQQAIALPAPATTGGMPLNEALAHRRSVRGFDAKVVTQEQISQLLWAAQGITDPATGHRAAPSAMAVYPLTIYVCTAGGVYSYQPKGHAVVQVASKDVREQVTQQPRGGGQAAPVTFVFTGDPSKFSSRGAERAASFIYLEVGHAAENLALEATALGLATVTQGGINQEATAKALNLPAGTLVVYAMPVGYPVAK